MKRIITSLTFFLLSSLFFHALAQIYVDSAAQGDAYGVSWSNAYTNLQDDLLNANANDIIRVAQGTYLPGDPGSLPTTTFLIDKNLVLLGGFNANTDEQNPAIFKTILSGDLNGDDLDSNFIDFKSDNVNHVLFINDNISNTTLIDGFTIKGGHADGASNAEKSGGGINILGSPVIRNCVFTYNFAEDKGGGIRNSGGSGTEILIEDCLFENNRANSGGGLFAWSDSTSNGVSVEVKGCSFEANSSDFLGGGASFVPWGNNTSYTIEGYNFLGS